MNFNAFFLKSFRILLFPFALLYGLIIIIRNYLYDKNILKSATFNFPLIGVGNLAVGGTGKSPMVEYLVTLLKNKYKVATLSRGYKRKTKGYVLATQNSTAIEIGDEPMQFLIKFPDVPIAVGEERIVAIPQLLHDHPNTEAVILDDAFQHRAIKVGLNILLTAFDSIFTQDFFLPTGDLRDQPSSYKRAHIIVVTKCPLELTETQKLALIKEISPLPHQHIFFTTIQYGETYHITHHSTKTITTNDEVLLICGIADPKPLKDYLFEKAATYYQQEYSDHHIFTIDDLKEITKKFDAINTSNKFILTTEKDAVRLIKFNQQVEQLPLYVLPIQHQFLFNEGRVFDSLIIDYINNFRLNLQYEQQKREKTKAQTFSR